MELTKQVVSLELAKRLKELGAKQESLFYWNILNDGKPTVKNYKAKNRKEFTEDGYPGNTMAYRSVEFYSAFTVAELGEMLPHYKKPYKSVRSYWSEKGIGAEIVLKDEDGEEHSKTHYADTEADARAEMLIYLLENNLTPSQETNI